jgi:hypothetical protein
LNLKFLWTPPYVGMTPLVTITCWSMKNSWIFSFNLFELLSMRVSFLIWIDHLNLLRITCKLWYILFYTPVE